MRRTTRALVSVLLAFGLAAPATGDETSVVQEVLTILKQRGLVDEDEYQRLSLANAAHEEREGLLSRVEWSGDARIRIESFWFDDTLLNDDSERTRFRHRLRLQGLVPVNEVATAGFRLVSGEDDIRATNNSAGRRDPDFDPDDVFLDRAFVRLEAPRRWLGEGTSLALVGGKQANPFRWKHGRDSLLWDSDIAPEGGALELRHRFDESWSAFLNAGYFVLDENTSAKDPHLLGLQGGLAIAASDALELGGRLSWYEFRSLDDDFFGRTLGLGATTSAGGNLNGGLTDGGRCNDGDQDGICDPGSSRGNDGISVGELAGYVRYRGIGDWPILLYGHYAKNFEAVGREAVVFETFPGGVSSSFSNVPEQDEAWGLGLEFGDKTRYLLLGGGYYRVEANAWPSQFLDSNILDGRPNREGWTVYGSRQLWPNTDLNVTFFESEPLETGLLYRGSVPNGDRARFQTDLVVKF